MVPLYRSTYQKNWDILPSQLEAPLYYYHFVERVPKHRTIGSFHAYLPESILHIYLAQKHASEGS